MNCIQFVSKEKKEFCIVLQTWELKLLQEINQPSLRACRINDMLVLVFFLALNKAAPSYISDLFTERQTSISLRGKRRLVILRVNTTNYGLHSFRYHASKLWNLLPDNVRVSTSLAAFTIALKTVQLNNECCSFFDQCWILKLPVHRCIFLSIIFNFYLN